MRFEKCEIIMIFDRKPERFHKRQLNSIAELFDYREFSFQSINARHCEEVESV